MAGAVLQPAGPSPRLDDLLALRALALDLTRLGRRRSRGRAGGEQRSRWLGQGREFAELKAYQPGEDVRRIDWRVTARRQTPYLRIMEADRRQPQLIWLELSASLHFGSERVFKSVLACHWAAFLAWRLSALGYPTRLLITGPGIELDRLLTRPNAPAEACRQLVEAHRQLAGRYLAGSQPPPASRLQPRLRHHPHLWLISDLTHFTPADLGSHLSPGRLHGLVLLQPVDRLETELSDVGPLEVAAGERSGRLDTGARGVRERHQRAFTERQQQWRDWAAGRGAYWHPSLIQRFDWTEVRQWPLPA